MMAGGRVHHTQKRVGKGDDGRGRVHYTQKRVGKGDDGRGRIHHRSRAHGRPLPNAAPGKPKEREAGGVRMWGKG